MDEALVMSAGGTLGVAILCLVAVGLRSWRTTKPLREGRCRSPGLASSTGEGSPATSWTTRLAAWAGAAICGLGLLSAATAEQTGARAWALMVSAFGGAVAGAGTVLRVTSVHAGPQGLEVRFAGVRPFHAAWTEIVQVRPPLTPIGGWRVVTTGGSRTLMPSDLLGREDALETMVRTAALVFDGRRWNAAMLPARGG